MTEKEAHTKALRIADMLMINVISSSKDGARIIREPKPVDYTEVNIELIMKVIME